MKTDVSEKHYIIKINGKESFVIVDRTTISDIREGWM